MDQKRLWSAVIATLTLAIAPAMAQQEEAPPVEEPGELVEEVIVVTASRTEQSLNEAPAAVSVLTAKDIESIPADNYGALLRNVPGLNVSQTSARDINMTSRGSTNTLSTSQLVLVDGRSLYLDFFGFVMWDFLPVNTAEIKQIEAVRGPGSAVWGANAMTGVVNLIGTDLRRPVHRARRARGAAADRHLRAGSLRAAGDPRGAELPELGYRPAQGRSATRLGSRR